MGESTSELERALRFLADLDLRVVGEQRPWQGGTAFLSPDLPQVWDANYFNLETAVDEDEVEGLGADAERIVIAAGLAHVAITVEDEKLAQSLVPAFVASGFERVRFVLMALRRPPAAGGDVDVEVVDAHAEAIARSRREVNLEAFPGNEELADQLGELDRRQLAAVGGRWLAVMRSGEVASRGWLREVGGVAQIEDVATSPRHRGQGLARAVVGAAARAAVASGNDLTFIVADADDTTPELYEKLGFEPLGRTYRFVRQPG